MPAGLGCRLFGLGNRDRTGAEAKLSFPGHLPPPAASGGINLSIPLLPLINPFMPFFLIFGGHFHRVEGGRWVESFLWDLAI